MLGETGEAVAGEVERFGDEGRIEKGRACG